MRALAIVLLLGLAGCGIGEEPPKNAEKPRKKAEVMEVAPLRSETIVVEGVEYRCIVYARKDGLWCERQP